MTESMPMRSAVDGWLPQRSSESRGSRFLLSTIHNDAREVERGLLIAAKSAGIEATRLRIRRFGMKYASGGCPFGRGVSLSIMMRMALAHSR